jgi:hypothetical protein
MKKKSYVVTVEVMMPVSIICEEIAESPAQARAKVKQRFPNGCIGSKAMVNTFRDAIDPDDIFMSLPVSVSRAEPAEEFHSPAECGLCAKVQGLKAGLVSIDLAEHIRKTFKGCTTLRALDIANQKED